MVNSRLITDLSPEVAAICQDHILRCAALGIEIIVTSTYRDYAAQDALYAIGRTVDPTRARVTNAKAGQSWHNMRAAYDVVPIVGGKAVWTSGEWKRVIECGKAAGAEAGAEWKTFPDTPHFQHTNGLTLAQAKVRFDAHGTIFT